MPPWLPVAVSVVLFVLTVVINVVVLVGNLKIKFAPSLEAAKRDLKLLGLRVIPWILNLISFGLSAYLLFLNVFSSEPLTRVAVFIIIISVGIPMFQVMSLAILYFISRINNQIYKATDGIYKSIDSICGEIKAICGELRALADIASDLNNAHSTHILLAKTTSDALFNHLDMDHSKAPPS